MKVETKQRKKTTRNFQTMSTEEDRMLGMLSRIIASGKRALDEALLDMGRMLAESIMLIEREELTGPDYYPTDPRLQKWAHQKSSVYVGDQKIKLNRPRLRDIVHGEVPLRSYEQMRSPAVFSEELLEKVLRGVSAQKYEETVLQAAEAFGVSRSSVSNKIVNMTALKLSEFRERSLSDFKPFAMFLDTIHRGNEAFIVALGVDITGEKKVLGFWEGGSENHVIAQELLKDLEFRGLKLVKRILFITDGGSGLIKALKERFGKKLLHQRCVLHKSRNLQKHLAKQYRRQAHSKLMAALEQNHYSDARQMLLELEKWLRDKNESAADSLLEAFEELLTLHRIKVPHLLRKSLMSTNPIESMFSLVRHAERNVKRSRGSKMLQRWLGTTLMYCEKQFNKVRGSQYITQVVSSMDVDQMLSLESESFQKAA